MGDTEDAGIDELGPVDYLLVEFPPGTQNLHREMAAELYIKRCLTDRTDEAVQRAGAPQPRACR